MHVTKRNPFRFGKGLHTNCNYKHNIEAGEETPRFTYLSERPMAIS